MLLHSAQSRAAVDDDGLLYGRPCVVLRVGGGGFALVSGPSCVAAGRFGGAFVVSLLCVRANGVDENAIFGA